MNIPIPDNEEARLTALHRLNILDTESEPRFDRITTLAQEIFGVSSAAVSMVDDDRQWFKSMCGWDTRESSRVHSFCTHAILDDSVLVVEDATKDDRFSDNPVVTKKGLRFYAGAPLSLDGDLRVGSLCLLDEEPHSFGPEDRKKLSTLAEIVVDLLDARRMTHQVGYLHSALAEARDTVIITEGSPIHSPGPRIVWVNKAFSRMTGYDRNEVIGETPRLLQGPATSRSVLNKVRSALENNRSVHAEAVNYRKDGSPYVVSWHIAPVYNDDGILTHWISIQRDITDQKRRDERLKHEATHDSLTRLPNRYAVKESIRDVVTASPNDGFGALLYIDLDDFKPINDTFGHQVGDEVLVRAADILRNVVRQQDTIGRIGGDEFVACLSTLAEPDEFRAIADRLNEALRRTVQIGPHEVEMSASIGGTTHLSSYESVDEALHTADTAMYEAKDTASSHRTAVLRTHPPGEHP